MSKLNLKVSNRTKDGEEIWEARVAIPGLRPTKLARKKDGETVFSSKSALLTSARNLARTLSFEGVEVE